MRKYDDMKMMWTFSVIRWRVKCSDGRYEVILGEGIHIQLPTQIHMEESMKIFSTNYVFVLQVLLLELDSMSRSRLFG